MFPTSWGDKRNSAGEVSASRRSPGSDAGSVAVCRGTGSLHTRHSTQRVIRVTTRRRLCGLNRVSMGLCTAMVSRGSVPVRPELPCSGLDRRWQPMTRPTRRPVRTGGAAVIACLLVGTAGASGCSGDPSDEAVSPAPPAESTPARTGTTADPPSPNARDTPQVSEPTLPSAAKGTSVRSAKAFVGYYIDLLNYASWSPVTLSLPRCDRTAVHVATAMFRPIRALSHPIWRGEHMAGSSMSGCR